LNTLGSEDPEGTVRWLVVCVTSSDQQLSDCFLVHFTPTQTCTEAFDKFFRSFVTDKQYSNACRSVSRITSSPHTHSFIHSVIQSCLQCESKNPHWGIWHFFHFFTNGWEFL